MPSRTTKHAARRFNLFPSPLEATLQKPLRKVMRKRRLGHDALLHYWPLAVGPQLAAIAHPLRIKAGKHPSRTQLLVKVHPAHRLIIAHQSEQILLKLTHYLGKRPAASIVCV